MMIFNEQQEQVIRNAVKWFKEGSDQVFEFDGKAGTGKSVVLNEIIRRLNLNEEEYWPMAYTGQAAIVMRLKGFPTARSIHSSIYNLKEFPFLDHDGRIMIDERYNVPKTYHRFVVKNKDEIPSYVKLFIIDECWLVTKDMREKIESFGIRILACGDAGQLPPIGGAPGFLVGSNTMHLTQIMRQEKDNPIVYLAERARTGAPIHCGQYGQNVLVINAEDLNDNLLSLFDTIICGTNRTREMMNKYVRQKIRGFRSDIPVYGDRMICRENNWNISHSDIALANGLSGTVVNSPDLTGLEAGQIYIDFIPDLANIAFNHIGIDFKYLQADIKDRQIMKNSNFKNGEKFEYAYALTTYLSQGAEYYGGIYMEEFMRPEIFNVQNYTGITRFRNFLVYVKTPSKFQIAVYK